MHRCSRPSASSSTARWRSPSRSAAESRSTQPLERIAQDAGARLIRGALAEVDDRTREAVTASGERLGYDALLVAVGAGTEPAFPRAPTWTPEADDEVFGGLLRDIEEGYSKRVAFVIPVGVAWPLPAYELALMTAWQADSMGRDDLEITIYTPESAPLEAFGTAADGGAARGPEAVGIARRDRRVRDPVGREGWSSSPAGARSRDTRVVALPRAVGPRPARAPERHPRLHPLRPARQGLRHGHGVGRRRRDRVPGQAGRARRPAGRWPRPQAIAARAGADVQPEPFRPVLRGVLLTGRGKAWMRKDLDSARRRGRAPRALLAADQDRRALPLAVPRRARRVVRRRAAERPARRARPRARPARRPPTRCALARQGE